MPPSTTIHPRFQAFSQPLGVPYQDNLSPTLSFTFYNHAWEHFQRRIRDLTHRANASGEQLLVRFGLLNSPSSNAVCGRQIDTQCIALYLPLMFELYEITGGFLSKRGLFPFFGDATSEKPDFSFKFPLGRNTRQYAPEDRSMIAEALNPVTPLRNMLRGYMANRVLEYIFIHELSHITEGHVDYFRREKHLQFLCELPIAAFRNPSDAECIHAEYAADFFGVRNLLHNILDGEHQIVGSGGSFPIEIAITSIWLGIIIVALIWMREAKDMGHFYTEETYPLPLKRLMFLRYSPLVMGLPHDHVIKEADVLVSRALLEIGNQFPEFKILSELADYSALKVMLPTFDNIQRNARGKFGEIREKYGYNHDLASGKYMF